jgi:hypothetical protein
LGEVWKGGDARLDRIVATETLKGEHNGRFLQNRAPWRH